MIKKQFKSFQLAKRTAIMLIATGFVVPQKTWIKKVSVPNVTGAAAAAASPAVLGGGVPGGVVSMPLSSIIFLQIQKTVKKKKKKKNIYIKCILRNKGKDFKLECKGHNTVIYIPEQSR